MRNFEMSLTHGPNRWSKSKDRRRTSSMQYDDSDVPEKLRSNSRLLSSCAKQREKRESSWQNQSTSASGLRTNKWLTNPRRDRLLVALSTQPNTHNRRHMASQRRRKTPAACPTCLRFCLFQGRSTIRERTEIQGMVAFTRSKKKLNN